jgi:hypothetical protein
MSIDPSFRFATFEEYTLEGPHGTVTLRTNKHHNLFDTIEDFLKHHDKTIQSLYYGASVILGSLSVYHAGKKLKLDLASSTCDDVVGCGSTGLTYLGQVNVPCEILHVVSGLLKPGGGTARPRHRPALRRG